MSIRNYIILSRLIILSLICSAALTGFLGAFQIIQNLERATFSSNQLQMLYKIKVSFDGLKLHTLHTLKGNAASGETLKQGSNNLSILIASLKDTTENEFEWLEGSPESAVEEEEKDRIRALISLAERSMKLAERIIITKNENPELAQKLFIQDLVGVLAPQIELVIQNSVSDEHSEIKETHLKIVDALIFYGSVSSFLLILAGFVLLMTGWVADRLLVRPMRQLSKTAVEMRKGTNPVTPHKSHIFEVGSLMMQFEKMSNELDRLRNKVEQGRLKFEDSTKEAKLEFQDTNKKLQKVIDKRAQFLADIGHELKTPLTALKSEAEICLRSEGHEEEKYRSTLTRMKVLCEQLNIIVDDIYFLARSETETLHFEFVRSDIEGIISSVIHNYEVFGRESNIQIVIGWADEPAEVLADVSKLKQALGIILDNAYKYSKPNSEIHVSIQNSEHDAVIVVTNTGQPIAKEDLPFIFERYYRGKGVTNKPGLGLGLGIAKWIVEKHFGKISLTSSAKGVTEVMINLPRA